MMKEKGRPEDFWVEPRNMQIFIFSLFDVAILPQLDLIFISPLFCQYQAKKTDRFQEKTKKLKKIGEEKEYV